MPNEPAIGCAYENAPAPVEIDEPEEWGLSDDTQLTLATCEAIIEAGGTVVPERIAARFAEWHKRDRVTGIGASTLKALTELSSGGHWALVGRKGERAAGNGAAMRIAPLAFCLDPTKYLARQTIRDVSRITHHHEEAYVGALAVVIAINAMLDRRWQGQEQLLRLVAESLPDTSVKDRLRQLAGLDESVPLLEIAGRFGCSGYVVESVPLALCGASRVGQLGFKMMLTQLIACGGDTDTIASIAGQVAGAFLGGDQLPREMLFRLPERQLIESVAHKFAETVKAND